MPSNSVPLTLAPSKFILQNLEYLRLAPLRFAYAKFVPSSVVPTSSAPSR